MRSTTRESGLAWMEEEIGAPMPSRSHADRSQSALAVQLVRALFNSGRDYGMALRVLLPMISTRPAFLHIGDRSRIAA